VCWCPIQLVLVLKSLALFEITPFHVLIQITSHVLAYMNSCVNPILYAFLSDNFRKAFRKVVYCRSLGFTLPSEHRQQPIEKPPANAGGTATTAVGNTTVKSTIVHVSQNADLPSNEAVDIL
jgi:hypothetical protein